MKCVLLIFTAAVVGIVNCGDEAEDAALFTAVNTEFTANMSFEVGKLNPSESFVLSAFSVLTPLAQLALASEGETHDELLTAIGLPDDQSIKPMFLHLNSKLESIKGVELIRASKIYVADGFALNDEFASMSRNIFQSEVKNVDFTRSKQTAKEINNWVADKTNHRITDIVDSSSISSDTKAVLVNAIYFKGPWKYPFKKSLTKPRNFYVSNDKIVKVPTMYNADVFNYRRSYELDAKILELPYEGNESAFYIILPNKVDGISALQNKLMDAFKLQDALSSLNKVSIEAYIPKFKIETTTNLKEMLQNLGVTGIFNPGANLTKLVDNQNDLYVSEAVQKAFIEIDEEGTEAAAANVFGVSVMSASMSKNKKFVADHPFVYVLKVDNNIVFSGVFRN